MGIPRKTFPDSLKRAFKKTIDAATPPADRVAGLYHVSEVTHIPGTSNTEKVTAGQLNFPARAGEFLVDQLVVVFKVPAFLPFNAHDAFATSQPPAVVDDEEGVKVQYVMQQGLQRQGLIMPIDKFPEIVELLDDLTEFYAGCRLTAEVDLCLIDVQALLGVKRWDPQAKITEESLGNAPTFYRKPKMSRLPECPNLFKKRKYQFLTYQETLKMDGSSMAVYFIRRDSPFFASLNPLPAVAGPHMDLENGRVGVCSMNKEINEPDDGGAFSSVFSWYWKVALKYNLPHILNDLNQDLVIQGELVGWNVNGNRHGYGPGEHDLFVFDIWEPRIQKSWLDANKVVAWCKRHRVQHVPVRGYVKLQRIATCHEDLQARADEVDGEGIVLKCIQHTDRRIKIHSRRYLEQYGPE